MRKIHFHKIIGGTDNSQILRDAVQNQKPRPIEGAVEIKNRIEERVREFIEQIT